MKVFSLRVGTHLILSERRYQVSKIIENNECLLEEIATGRSRIVAYSALLQAWSDGELSFFGAGETPPESTDRNTTTLGQLPEDEQQDVRKRRHYVTTAERRLGLHPNRRHLDMAIAHAANEIADPSPPSVSTVYRWWRRWHSSHHDISALRNRVQKAKKSWKFNKLAVDTLNEVVESVYLTRQKATLQQTYDEYCYRMNQLNGLRPEPVAYPSRAQFYRLVSQYNAYEVMKSREGKRTAERHFRMAGKGVDTSHILERVEVDHTPMDVFALNPETGLADGRPYLTVLLDHYSKMPLGFSLSFEPPSELSVMRALRHSVLPKSYIKAKYPDIESSWDAYGVPLMLVCDNGLEFHSDQLKRVCEELNTELVFCPKGEPNYKGSVERFQGTLNRAVSHRLAGTSFSSIQHRGDYDSQKHAAVTLQQLDELVHAWIVDIYLNEIHRGIQQTPALRWTNGLTNYSPVLPVSMTQFELSLCKQTQRLLRHTGIELFGLFYNSRALADIRQRITQVPKVKINYDPENLGRIWVLDPFQGDFLIVECTEPEYANGLSLVAHKSIRRDTRKAAENDYDASTQLERKHRFTKKIKQMQTSNKVTTRRRAARHKTILEQTTPPNTDTVKTNSRNDTVDLIDSLPDLPFKYRGGTKT